MHISIFYCVAISFYNDVKLMSREFGIGDNYVSNLNVSHIIEKIKAISIVHIYFHVIDQPPQHFFSYNHSFHHTFFSFHVHFNMQYSLSKNHHVFPYDWLLNWIWTMPTVFNSNSKMVTIHGIRFPLRCRMENP